MRRLLSTNKCTLTPATTAIRQAGSKVIYRKRVLIVRQLIDSWLRNWPTPTSREIAPPRRRKEAHEKNIVPV